MGFLWIFLSFLLYQGVDTEGVSVSVNEGDSVTLNTDVIKQQKDRIKWYINDTRIAQINGHPCTDVQCNEGTESFRDRLKLDHQTGSLTIMNITNTHSGEYKLMITGGGSDTEKIFSVSVHGVSAAERDEVKRKLVKEGENVTLDSGKIRKPKDVMTWYFNDTFIAEITGDQSKICTDVQCKERFRDRLKLDHQTGSLTIMNTRNTHSGVYQLKINNSISGKIFHVSVTDSDPDPGVVAGIVVGVVGVLLVFVAAALGVIYYRRRISRKNMGGKQQSLVSLDSVDPVDSVEIPISETEHFLQTRGKNTRSCDLRRSQQLPHHYSQMK